MRDNLRTGGTGLCGNGLVRGLWFGGFWRRRDRRDGVWQKGGIGSETRGFSFWWILVERGREVRGQTEVRCGETKTGELVPEESVQ